MGADGLDIEFTVLPATRLRDLRRAQAKEWPGEEPRPVAAARRGL